MFRTKKKTNINKIELNNLNYGVDVFSLILRERESCFLIQSISIISPSLMLFETTFSAIKSSIYFCIALFRGLAPYFLSYPFSVKKSLAFDLTSSL